MHFFCQFFLSEVFSAIIFAFWMYVYNMCFTLFWMKTENLWVLDNIETNMACDSVIILSNNKLSNSMKWNTSAFFKDGSI